MNFKAPRDPNTPHGLLVLRKIAPSENILCDVGSGECLNKAVELHDDGAGGGFPVCAHHLPDLYALSKLIAEMTPNQVDKFETVVAEAVRNEKN